jgi:putative phage-type endonuclease
MKVFDMEQRSKEWFAVRCGVITGSGINRLLTAKTVQFAKGKGDDYIDELLAERLTGRIIPIHQSQAMKRGVELESEALAWYMMETNRAVKTVGFVKHDNLEIGASPDGIAEDRGIEIKCPLDKGHATTLRSGQIPEKYYPQVQTCMWLTGLKYWDYVSYTDSNMPNFILTVPFDEVWVSKMLEVVLPVHDELQKLEEQFKNKETVYGKL